MAIGLSGCVGKAQDQSLKFGVMPVIDNLPWFVAQEKGYFEQVGVEVELVNFSGPAERDTALTAGEIDGAIGDNITGPLLYATSKDPVKIVSLGLGVTPEEGRFVILSSPNSGITTPEQIKGVEVAISVATMMEYITDEILKYAGLSADEIVTTAIPAIPIRFESLMSDQIKVAILPDPLAALAEKGGAHPVLDDSKIDINLSQSIWAFRESSIKEKKGAITKLFEAYNLAVADIAADPASYRPLLVKYANLPEAIADTFEVPTFQPAQAPKREDIERAIAWMVEKGLLDAPVAYDDLVDASPLP